MSPPTTPTIAQQRGLAFAPMPFAAISFLASTYVIHHLLWKQQEKLKRLYHRLVLAMNFALIGLSISRFWTFAVPAGTPFFAADWGTVNTCTVQGFMSLMFALVVPTYYASLSLQAVVAMKYKFEEEKYKWIEIPIHLMAWCFPFAMATVFVVTENFNPRSSGCWTAKAPLGCEEDPAVPCQRGADSQILQILQFVGTIFLLLIYFVVPPSAILAMYCWISKMQKKAAGGSGMQRVRDSARKRIMRCIAKQVTLYLGLFWFTWSINIINKAFYMVTKEDIYNLKILGNVMFASQGFIFAVVYFMLHRMGTPAAGYLPTSTVEVPTGPQELTLAQIRSNAQTQSEPDLQITTREKRESSCFNIFDGVPDPDSPWAKFLDCDSTDSRHEGDIEPNNVM